MRRILVAGGRGFFGRAAVEELRQAGLSPLVASRSSSADLQVNVEDGESLRKTLRDGDVILDAVGPFQQRSTALIQAALEIGCDVVDLSDSLAYAGQVLDMEPAIAASGRVVLTACSSVSAISAAAAAWCEVDEPVSLRGWLVPATRHSAVVGTAASLLDSVGREIQVFRDGRLVAEPGFSGARSFPFPPPVGTRQGYRFETADSLMLPRAWPSLQATEFLVDTNVRGLNSIFRAAAGRPWLAQCLRRCAPWGLKLARLLGRNESGIGYEIQSSDGRLARLALIAPRQGYLMAVTPAVLALAALAHNTYPHTGLPTPDRYVDPQVLRNALEMCGVRFVFDLE